MSRNIRKYATALLVVMILITGCGNRKQKVTCVMCNGSGEVKFYYGEGDYDYSMGPCSSCDEKGYVLIVPSGKPGLGKRIICGSCEKYVDSLETKQDATGDSRTWCSTCWERYDDIMGR